MVVRGRACVDACVGYVCERVSEKVCVDVFVCVYEKE